MNRLKLGALLGGAAFVAGCPSMFLPPNANVQPGRVDGTVGMAALAGPIGGHWRVKLFDRTRTKEFDLNLEQAGRYVSGRFSPLNEDPPPKWTADGEYTISATSITATMSVVLTLGSTTSAEPATGSITVQGNFVMGDFSLASPAPSPLPTPTPVPAPTTSSGSSPIYAEPMPAKMPYPGGGFYSQSFVGTWSDGGQSTGSVTAIKFSPK